MKKEQPDIFPQSALLLSIKPEFVRKIELGEKTVELRRIRPRITSDGLIIVYETAPAMRLCGAFIVGKVVSGEPMRIWNEYGPRTGITAEDYFSYFEDADSAFAITIKQYWRLRPSIPLAEMRRRKNINPPQSYQYLDEDEVEQLLCYT